MELWFLLITKWNNYSSYYSKVTLICIYILFHCVFWQFIANSGCKLLFVCFVRVVGDGGKLEHISRVAKLLGHGECPRIILWAKLHMICQRITNSCIYGFHLSKWDMDRKDCTTFLKTLRVIRRCKIFSCVFNTVGY